MVYGYNNIHSQERRKEQVKEWFTLLGLSISMQGYYDHNKVQLL
jgi:hypothetical protein